MGHDSVASGYPTPTDFRKLPGFQRDPWDRGVTLSFLLSLRDIIFSQNNYFCRSPRIKTLWRKVDQICCYLSCLGETA